MLYSPERNSLPGKASHNIIFFPADAYSGDSTKEKNGSSMGRGYKIIGKLSAIPLRTLPLLLLGCLTAFGSLAAHAQSASTWDKRGVDAEARENFDAAFEDYQHAVKLKPNDLRYKTHLDRTRFLAAASHVDRGRVLRQNGDLNGALTEYNRALLINPGSPDSEGNTVFPAAGRCPGRADASPERDTLHHRHSLRPHRT
jgi:general secretion pathway protein D